ncbi:hypothetical protein [Sphingomonas immobilis]|uniref:Uncharacterized protein n=1 Tax=Sphingomonas immobilis TaxID=3063997 RepID=A0ABT8ZWA7_9SPHN|nr:hypothetical protein [Sphingomonas sp. CA1-15]MDO7841860.1 hypothetical protein [Sphingomonas sp. CA1-15]
MSRFLSLKTTVLIVAGAAASIIAGSLGATAVQGEDFDFYKAYRGSTYTSLVEADRGDQRTTAPAASTPLPSSASFTQFPEPYLVSSTAEAFPSSNYRSSVPDRYDRFDTEAAYVSETDFKRTKVTNQTALENVEVYSKHLDEADAPAFDAGDSSDPAPQEQRPHNTGQIASQQIESPATTYLP